MMVHRLTREGRVEAVLFTPAPIKMVYPPREDAYSSEEDDIAGIPRSATRFNTRRERISGLGIKGLDMPPSPSSSSSNEGNLRSLRRKLSDRRSIVSFIGKPAESPKSSKPEPERPPSSSRSSRLPTPPLSHSDRTTPTSWNDSNSTINLADQSSVEDLTTFTANLARFKAERAQRAAELGLSSYDLCRTDSPGLNVLPVQEDQTPRSTGLGLGKGLRAYWGGGSGSSNKLTRGPSKPTKKPDPYWDEKADKEALKEWWDNLGS